MSSVESPEVPGGRRRGGRQARVALRSSPLADDVKPIRPGMTGGTYRPLDEFGISRINQAAMDSLEQIGLGQPTPSCIEVCTAAGAILNDEGRLLFPRAMVEDTIAKACRNLVLHGQDPKHDMEIGGKHYHVRLLAPVFLVLEIPLHFARILTLGIRLLANMFADHTVVLVWLGMVPLAVPAIFMGLGLLVSFLQAFVFALLTMIYIGQALEEPH